MSEISAAGENPQGKKKAPAPWKGPNLDSNFIAPAHFLEKG